MFEVIDTIDKVKHTLKSQVSLARLIRDLTLHYGDIAIEEEDEVIIISK